jgi:acyl-CoA synthetase (AMP-forming)/AMP-acid ligase II
LPQFTTKKPHKAMLGHLMIGNAVADTQEAIVTRAGSTTWSALREQVLTVLEDANSLSGRRVGIVFHPTASSYAALAALQQLSADAFLFDSRVPLDATMHLATKFKLGALLSASGESNFQQLEVFGLPGEAGGSGNATVTILTSGSTGEPKAARHSWETLSRPVRQGTANMKPRWLLTYRPNLYAGLQVMLQCFADHGTLIIPGHDAEPQVIAQFMSDSRVQYVSATPSFWRRILMFADPDILNAIPLVQITLGGEIIDQVILDKLKHHFPKSRLAHIYATTELGRCFSVNDSLAGFPASYLKSAMPDGCEVKVEDGELLVRSPNSMRMYDPLSAEHSQVSDWFGTGDLVEITNSRVYFVGRKSDMINVAGSKVYPAEVERVIRSVPGVSDVRVFGKRSSIAGELVACEIVPDKDQSQSLLKEAINRYCRASLTTYQQPRIIRFVERIELSAAGKTLRTGT